MLKHEIFGIPVNALTYQDAVDWVAERVAAGKSSWILAINPEKIMKALADEKLRRLLLQADLFIPDGIGILWAGKVLGKPFPQRVTGVDILVLLVKEAATRGWKIFLLGAPPGISQEVARGWELKYPGLQVVGHHHGYFKEEEEAQVVSKISAAAPDLLFVAMGSPRQEQFIVNNRAVLGAPVCMGVGGSFDVLSGRKKRAPVWMQRIGLEWSYRLLLEPRRILRMSALPKFVILVIRRKLGMLKLEGDKK
ncbi:MAG: WecB/TagA/CpsF family glycosyltransferase [Dethiobacter sp.]|nr:WecB/TagA/CpsF family glycosyltransferase [Dethiobacter sp.]MBS3982831.1 WecB/TagA/CpsF family glycosyltransferase [Dethiobacter sp.]MBS3983687.1 WecB/TagA/CpsF family glycosyltransferase [Dethiobacter sp.]MCL4463221.1 WecB/TagA/CpsF family glycosyltransferase [Bacillota bacterium]MCL5993136.1 WecB/TagA/CpsF family glycosyltransferase [Bacillota bacterium]